MAVIIPFRAWRYNAQKVGDIRKQFSPLFDVVQSSHLKLLYQQPYNAVHVAMPQSHESAVDKWADWKKEQIVVQDKMPAIYVYYQIFRLPNDDKLYTRKGFVCMVKIKDEEESDIVLHENTLSASIKDRVELLNKLPLNVTPTHGLYDDSAFQLEDLMDKYIQKPLYEYEDAQGTMNKVAIINNPQHISAFQSVLQEAKIYLADGHHRLESSRVLREEWKAEKEVDTEDGVNYHMMYLTNLASDDLKILPTHRIWRPSVNPGIEVMLQRLSTYFEISDVSGGPRPMYEYLAHKKYAFGFMYEDYEFLLELKPHIHPHIHISVGLPNVVKELGYTILHYFVFEKVCGIPYLRQNVSPTIAYEKGYSQAVQAAGRGAYVFICKEVTMAEMMQVCNSGAIMPQKATYFYPKVVCGMFFASIEDKMNE